MTVDLSDIPNFVVDKPTVKSKIKSFLSLFDLTEEETHDLANALMLEYVSNGKLKSSTLIEMAKTIGKPKRDSAIEKMRSWEAAYDIHLRVNRLDHNSATWREFLRQEAGDKVANDIWNLLMKDGVFQYDGNPPDYDVGYDRESGVLTLHSHRSGAANLRLNEDGATWL